MSYLLLSEACDCDRGHVKVEFVDYGVAGGGWRTEPHLRCNGTGVYRRKVEYVAWLHSRPPTDLVVVE